MNEKAIYVGNGKEKFNGETIEFSLSISKLRELKEHFFEYNNVEYIKLKVCKKKEVDQYGNSHNVQVNTFKPAEKGVVNKATTPTMTQATDEFEDAIPF